MLSAELQHVRLTASQPPEPVFTTAREPAATPIEVDATPEPDPTATAARPTTAPRVLTANDAAPCAVGQIRGNRNSKIYHVPGGASYTQTRANVQCFNTEAEAQASGYRRALN
jgi:micrococcal nuclease